MPTIPLRGLVDDENWEAEDLAGRLGIVAHAAFLCAGFVPDGDEPRSGHLLKQVDEIGPSAPRLSRRYTAAQLARRDDADAAVLELRAWGNGDVAFQAYLPLTRDGERRRLSCEAVLHESALAPLLSRCLADAARALETGSAGSWLWKSLADWVVPTLLLDICRRNNLPVTDFASLPDETKAEILKRLADGKDLARVECASRELRRLVAERDDELWKAMYASLGPPLEAQSSDSEGMSSWKERYVEGRLRLRRRHLCASLFGFYDDEVWFARYRREHRQRVAAELLRRGQLIAAELESQLCRFEQEIELQLRPVRVLREDPLFAAPIQMQSTGFSYFQPNMGHYPPAPAPKREVAARGTNGGRQHRKVQRNHYQKKRHGAGAIHSQSSRYRWKHR